MSISCPALHRYDFLGFVCVPIITSIQFFWSSSSLKVNHRNKSFHLSHNYQRIHMCPNIPNNLFSLLTSIRTAEKSIATFEKHVEVQETSNSYKIKRLLCRDLHLKYLLSKELKPRGMSPKFGWRHATQVSKAYLDIYQFLKKMYTLTLSNLSKVAYSSVLYFKIMKMVRSFPKTVKIDKILHTNIVKTLLLSMTHS